MPDSYTWRGNATHTRSPVSFLVPARIIPYGMVPVRADKKAAHAERVSMTYWRVTTLVDDGESFGIVGGMNESRPPAAPMPLAAFAALRVSLEDGSGREQYIQSITSTIRPIGGDIAQFACGVGPHVSIFGTWYPTVGACVARIVLRNGVIDTSGAIPVQDLRGRLRIWHGDTKLLDMPDQVHHFGRMRSYLVAIAVNDTGEAISASIQRATWPGVPTVDVPLDAYAGIIPSYHGSVMDDAARPDDVDSVYPMGISASIIWPEGGSSGGGKPTLAPLPQHDVYALHNPSGRLDKARLAADTFPYPYFFTDPEGEWITPQQYPKGWIDQNKFPDGVSLADFGGVRVLKHRMEPSPYRADVAHLPNPYVVPSILTGDPYYGWAATGLAFGAAMQSRGLAGGWKDRDGMPLATPPENTRNSRGPTGREGWIGREERGWGWGLLQRAHAFDIGGDSRVVDLIRTCMVIARGHYLDKSMHPTDELRQWGYHCCPWWYGAVWQDGDGRPEAPRLSDGSDAYVSATNAIDAEFTKAAHAGWQDAFMVMAINKVAGSFAGIESLGWIDELKRYASAQRLYMLQHGLPVTEYAWPIRGHEGGWMYGDMDILDGWIQPIESVTHPGRSIKVDENGLNMQRAYVGFNAVGFESPMDSIPGYADVIDQIAPEWRVV